MLYREKKKSPMQDVRNFFHGTVADRCMRRWLESDDPRPGEMASWVDEMIDFCLGEARDTGDGVVRWKSSSDRADMAEWIRVLLGRLEPMLQQWVLPFHYQPEFGFRVPIRIPDPWGNTAEIDLTGGMDILVRESLDPLVWVGFDLKATANPDYISKTLGQGIFYDLAVFAGTGVAPRDFVFLMPMVERNPVVHVTVTDADRMSLLSRIVKMAHDVWQGDTAPKADAGGCSWCSVRHGCQKFKPSGQVWAPKLGKRSTELQAARAEG